MTDRYIPNDFSPLLTLGDTKTYLRDALEQILKHCPPLESYSGVRLAGLWEGPTGIAYLFLHVSAALPDLKIDGHHAITWAKEYLRGSRGHLHLEKGNCGFHSEWLCFLAVRACTTKDPAHVREFLSDIPAIVGHDFPDEMLYGRAGTLYLLRMIRHWVPDSASLVEPAVASVSEKIMSEGTDWTYHGSRYLGSVHGDIGIVTQLVRTTPALAERLEPKLAQLLSMQWADGNWPAREGSSHATLTQFCHGAPGFVISLLSIGRFFPSLQDRVKSAVQKGRECIWKQGLLRKEPSLCHGVFSNALALPLGRQREHFLAMATPENIARMRSQDSSLFEPADFGMKYGITPSYRASAAWSWLVHDQESPGIIAYNDV
ncbi:LanC-like protein 2 [Pleurostoma richardsiae]|uniref:LanC-like protein 2 n=1 Tax=Pleurostoma richardsiae TaxID=41990 RepID=A0AA38S9F8_9PEZI|nr:LanC-like protein 2 [Pleurostoma richardsiae]